MHFYFTTVPFTRSYFPSLGLTVSGVNAPPRYAQERGEKGMDPSFFAEGLHRALNLNSIETLPFAASCLARVSSFDSFTIAPFSSPFHFAAPCHMSNESKITNGCVIHLWSVSAISSGDPRFM